MKSLVKSSALPKIQFDGLGSAGSTLTFYNLSRRYAYFIVALAKRGCVYCKQVQVSGPDDVSVQIDKCLQGTRLYLVYDSDCVQLFDDPISFSDAGVESKLSEFKQNWTVQLKMQPRAYVCGEWVESEVSGDKKGNLVVRIGKKTKFLARVEQCEAWSGRNRDLVLLTVQ